METRTQSQQQRRIAGENGGSLQRQRVGDKSRHKLRNKKGVKRK